MQTEEYLKLAAVEDRMWYFRALHAHVERELERRLPGPAAILDAGCGTGGLIRRLAPRAAWKWTGVDLSPLAIELAQQRCAAGTDLREASVTKLPFADDSFDAVVSADVLYHVDDDVAALGEFFRVLRPGGFAIVNVPAYRWLWSYHDVAVQARRRYGRGEVLAKLRTAGFADTRATFWNTLPFPLIVVRRKLWPAPKHGSDVTLYAPPLETGFDALMAIERACIRGMGRLPFGCSVFATGIKRGNK